MSSTFDETVKALQDNPELRARVMSATSTADRNTIPIAAGFPRNWESRRKTVGCSGFLSNSSTHEAQETPRVLSV